MKKYILTLLVTSFIFSCNENSINYNQIDSMINNEIEANKPDPIIKNFFEKARKFWKKT